MIHIKHRFTSLNKYTNANRRNVHVGNKIKQDETYISYLHFRGVKIPTPAKLIFTWSIPNKGNDLDNQSASGRKFIIDGIVKAKALENDNLNHIVALEDRYIKGEWGVTIEWEKM